MELSAIWYVSAIVFNSLAGGFVIYATVLVTARYIEDRIARRKRANRRWRAR